jgi:uncharacterized phage protein (TIGR01671 family)
MNRLKECRVWDISAQEFLKKKEDPFKDNECEPLYFPTHPQRMPTTLGWAIQNEQDYVVQEYTGLTDIEGNKIFEGDILSSESAIYKGEHFLATYYKGEFIRRSLKDGAYDYLYESVVWLKTKVVGHIFELKWTSTRT